MYKVFFDDFPLHDPRSLRHQLREPNVRLAVGEAGEMSFIIDKDHPHAGELVRMKGVVELKAGPVRLFRGRIRKDTEDFYLDREIEVEGLLACLNDSVIPPFDFPGDFLEDAAYQTAAETGNVVAFFLNWILEQHNAQVTGAAQKIELGTVTVADPNNYISRASSDYLASMEVVRKKLVELLGGYLIADYSGETTVLHYYADLPLTNVQTVKFGENLLDVETELDSIETYTAILPVGKDGLTIATMEDGEVDPGIVKTGLIIYNTAAETAAGGRITRKINWDDVTDAHNLQRKAIQKLMGEGTRHVRTITVKAVDLGGENDIPRFTVGRYVVFESPPHGYNSAYPLMVLEPDILDPGNTNIVLGETALTSSDLANKNQNAIDEKFDRTQIQINQQKDDLQQQAEETRQQITQAIQTCEQIIFSALESYVRTSDLDTYKRTVESQFSIMADEISLRFAETTEQIENVSGDLQQTRETLQKHFDFGIDGLKIRAGENAMSIRIDNNLIIFEKAGQQFGWWDGVDFHTGNIVIDVQERAQFGKFAAIPRSSGNLSWLTVNTT